MSDAFRQIAEAIPQLVWTTRPDGYHDYYNQRWYEYTGTTPGQAQGEGLARPLPPRGHAGDAAALAPLAGAPASSTRRSTAAAAMTASTAGSWAAPTRYAMKAGASSGGSAPARTSTTRSAPRTPCASWPRRASCWPLRRWTTRARSPRSPGWWCRAWRTGALSRSPTRTAPRGRWASPTWTPTRCAMPRSCASATRPVRKSPTACSTLSARARRRSCRTSRTSCWPRAPGMKNTCASPASWGCARPWCCR